MAVFRKHHAAVRALLRLGANPNALEAQRFDVVTIAVAQNDLEMLKLLLEAGASPRNVTSDYDGTALSMAARLGHTEAVNVLIAAGAPLDHVNRMGWTALIEAVVLGNGGANHVAIVEALVKAGADTEIADRNGRTALAHAQQRRYTDIVQDPGAAPRTPHLSAKGTHDDPDLSSRSPYRPAAWLQPLRRRGRRIAIRRARSGSSCPSRPAVRSTSWRG